LRRLNEKQRNLIKNLALEGFSLNTISKKLNLPKTTVYYWFRKAVGRKIKKVKINDNNKEKVGEIIGLFAGDGNFFFDKKNCEYRVRFYLSRFENNILKHYFRTIASVFGKNPRVYTRESMNIMEIVSKDVISFIRRYLIWDDGSKTQTIKLSKGLDELSPDFLIGITRGLIDSDGYVRKNRREIYFGTVSKGLLKNFIDYLNKLDIKFKVYRQIQSNCSTFFKLRITNEEVAKFCNLIKPIKSYGHAGI